MKNNVDVAVDRLSSTNLDLGLNLGLNLFHEVFLFLGCSLFL